MISVNDKWRRVISCIFCRIAQKIEPSYILWEDEKHVVFLDKYPKRVGQIQVIPKKHSDYFWEMSDEELAQLMMVVKKMAIRLKMVSGAGRVLMQVLGGQVRHTHVWLWPNTFDGISDKGQLEKILERWGKLSMPAFSGS